MSEKLFAAPQGEKRTLLIAMILILLSGFWTLAESQTFTTIDFPGAQETWLWGINDRGESGGFYIDSSGIQHLFRYKTKRGFVPLDGEEVPFEHLRLVR